MGEKNDPNAEEREKWRNFHRSAPQSSKCRVRARSRSGITHGRRVSTVPQRVRVEFAGILLADSARAWRVCETSSPPVYYLPPEDVQAQYLEPYQDTSFCEWKGSASYWTVRVGDRVVEKAAWSYEVPDAGYEALRGYLAFYAGKMDVCYVGEHRVTAQPGEYYGG